MKVLTLVARHFYFLFLCIKADIRSVLFGKKILNRFLYRANQDATFKMLLKAANVRNLRLIYLPGIFEVLGAGMSLFKKESSLKIAISIELMKKFLEKAAISKKIYLMNFARLSFAHELGHFDQINLETNLEKERKKTCEIKGDCFYIELLASKRGLQIIRKITGKEITKKLLGDLMATSIIQCHRYGCFDFLRKDASKCPKINKIKEMVELIFIENGISCQPLKDF